MALLAFEDVRASPVADLMDIAQRQKTASELNAAILSSQSQVQNHVRSHLSTGCMCPDRGGHAAPMNPMQLPVLHGSPSGWFYISKRLMARETPADYWAAWRSDIPHHLRTSTPALFPHLGHRLLCRRRSRGYLGC